MFSREELMGEAMRTFLTMTILLGCALIAGTSLQMAFAASERPGGSHARKATPVDGAGVTAPPRGRQPAQRMN